MELSIFTKKIYDYFAYTIYEKKLDWRLVNGKKSQKSIETFSAYMLEKHGAGAGPSFVWLYIMYQFGRFELTNFRPESHTDIILPTMIFGQQAIKKYEERKTIDTLTLRSPWMQKFNLSQQEFVRKYGLTFTTSMEKVNHKKVIKSLMKYKDPIKYVTSTTNQGMDLCEDLTDMYNEQDVSCQSCPYAEMCKSTLKQTNSKLYELKGYE